MRNIVLALFVLVSAPAYADIFQPSHNCFKPYKPLQFSSQFEIDTFNAEVSRYRLCIEDFVRQQEQAIQNHEKAAKDAVEEWNWFVSFELN